jgi:hypothetical protein
MELLEYVVDFEKHNTIKSQILVDFIEEWTEPSSQTKRCGNHPGLCIVIELGAMQELEL